MPPLSLLIWCLFVAFVVSRAVRYLRMRRYGWGIALLFVALFVGYEAAMQWRDAQRVEPEPPPEVYRDETLPRGAVELAPPPEASQGTP